MIGITDPSGHPTKSFINTIVGLYTDGKKTPTLVRDVTETKVRVPGARGKAAYKVVQSVSNKLEVQDHYPVVGQPSGEYVTHVTPSGSCG